MLAPAGGPDGGVGTSMTADRSIQFGRLHPTRKDARAQTARGGCRGALSEFRPESLVHFGGRFFRGRVQRALQFNGGASRPDGETVEARGRLKRCTRAALAFRPAYVHHSQPVRVARSTVASGSVAPWAASSSRCSAARRDRARPTRSPRVFRLPCHRRQKWYKRLGH
jgi:hypothetical protein